MVPIPTRRTIIAMSKSTAHSSSAPLERPML
jgi:hypothetical protein